jgi:hypothetical protein
MMPTFPSVTRPQQRCGPAVLLQVAHTSEMPLKQEVPDLATTNRGSPVLLMILEALLPRLSLFFAFFASMMIGLRLGPEFARTNQYTALDKKGQSCNSFGWRHNGQMAKVPTNYRLISLEPSKKTARETARPHSVIPVIATMVVAMKLVPLKQFICDECGGVIGKPDEGWLEFHIESQTLGSSGFRIVHHATHSPFGPGACYHRANLSGNHLHHVLGPDVIAELLFFLHYPVKKMEEYMELVRRLHPTLRRSSDVLVGCEFGWVV